MKLSGKTYEPVREFERQTSREAKAEGRRLNAEVGLFEEKASFCPLYLAWHFLDEAWTNTD